jgi:GrpB-like predicted nucleotidyltransferase (UPF0157 family)
MDWTPYWQQRFALARDELAAVLDPDATIEHVGSTSVAGLPAKPIIDILIVTTQLNALRLRPGRLQALRYQPRPAPFADTDHLFFVRDTDGLRSEHLHAFHPRSPRPQTNRDFRDYLIAHPEQARRYAEAKRKSAAANPFSRGDYGRGKSAVFSELLTNALAWAARQRRELPGRMSQESE